MDYERNAAPGEPCRIHYRTPSEYGSSGSPVFNANWDVVAVHHKADNMARLNGKSDTYAANEGISISSIISAFKGQN